MYKLTGGIGLNFENLKITAYIGANAPKARDIEARGVPVEWILDCVRILSDAQSRLAWGSERNDKPDSGKSNVCGR